MPGIKFTQYLRPMGRRRDVWIKRPGAIALKALAIRNAGYHFDCEELVTGDVSLTIGDEDDDYACEVVRNGAEVPIAVDRLIERFYAEKFGGSDVNS